jgi:hypothetical protein
MTGHQSPLGQQQIYQTKQRQQLHGILGYTSIVSLLMFEQILRPIKRIRALLCSMVYSTLPNEVLGNARQLPGRIATCQFTAQP